MAKIVKKGEFYQFFTGRPGNEVGGKLSHRAAAIEWLERTGHRSVYTLALSHAKKLAKVVFPDTQKHLPHKATYFRHFQPLEQDPAAQKHIFFDSRGDEYVEPDYNEPQWKSAREAMDAVWSDSKQRRRFNEIRPQVDSAFDAFLQLLKEDPGAQQAVVNFGKARVAQYLAKLQEG